MKMDDMNKYFEAKGFEVERAYSPYPECRKERGGFYLFTISKGGDYVKGVYEWPNDQLMFMDRMIEGFEKRFPRHNDSVDALASAFDAMKRYVDTDLERTKQLVNGIYGNPAFKFDIKKVIFNDPATIVLWEDGTKTVVKAEGEKFDPEKGLAMAISKKALGNKGNYYNTFTKWLPKDGMMDILEKLVQLNDTFDKLRARFAPKGE